MRFRLATVVLLSFISFIPMRAFAVDMPMNGEILSRDQRLSNAVTDQRLVLDDGLKSILTLKCQTAQQTLTKIQEKTEKTVALRNDTYGSFQKELLAIKLRMARQGVDASEIDLLIGKLQQKLDLFTLTANAYGTSLDDVIAVDCVQKPEQFKAGLVIMRAKRSELEATAKDLKTTMQSAQQNMFEQLKNRLRV